MTTLTIRRFHTTVHDPGEEPRVDRMLRRLTDDGLDRGLARAPLPDGEWCVRRVDVTLPVDSDDSDAEVEGRWVEALLASIRRGLEGASSDVVRYARREHALHDLVTSLALGRADRAWAWRQVGVARAGDPDPVGDPAGAVLAALDRAPHQALAAVAAAVRMAGAVRVHRLFDGPGWAQVALLAAMAAGATRHDSRALLSESSINAAPDAAARAERVLLDARFVRVLAESGLRPTDETARAWAVLALAEADPAALAGRSAAARVHAVAEAIRRRSAAGRHRPGLVSPTRPSSSPASPAGPAPSPSTRQPGRVDAEHAHGAAAANHLERDAGEGPRGDEGFEPEEASASATVWGGLLFLFATAADAGVPDELVDDPRLAARPLRWVLHHLALRLVPAASDDPAVRAFAGLAPDAEAPAGEPPTDVEDEAIGHWAERWTSATVARLPVEDGQEPADVIAAVARRRADVVAEPGWIEIHLDLAAVDVDVRRAGLDLDPGWVPWLGVVVRFVYA